ncbi:MAG: alpha/beta fold hydrolase [Chloroflexota bacterium]
MNVMTIIAIHGNGGGGFRFARLEPHLPEDVRLIHPTLPGFAERSPDPNLRTLHDYAEYIDGIVQAQPRPRVLLGTGIGGAFVLEYVQHHVDAVDGIILHAPVGARLEARRFPALMKLPGMRALGQWLFSSRLTRPLFKRLLFVNHRAIPPEYLDQFFEEYRRCQVFGQMFDIINASWYASLKPVSVPAALLWGADERILNPEHIEDYRALLPEAAVRIVDGWDHFPMIEEPAAYAHELVELARPMTSLAHTNATPGG